MAKTTVGEMKRTLLRNAVLIDGGSEPSFKGHLLLSGDRIEAVLTEKEPEPSADTVLDVAGSVVAPGFIDMHSHVDWVMPLQNHATLLSCLLEQGITTVVAGNCGISVAPVHADRVRRLSCLKTIVSSKPTPSFAVVDSPIPLRLGRSPEFSVNTVGRESCFRLKMPSGG